MANPAHGPNAELTVAIALAAGVLMQSLARHLRVPGIVLLLLAGVVLGPDVAGIIDPGRIPGVVHGLVSFAVAVILFEGGMNMNISRLRHEARVIRLLVTVGALVTAIGGTFVGRFVLGWNWQLSILLGTLVIVTGPTVVTPLLRRIKIRHNLETILEAEGVFIDAVGAIIAIVALTIAVQPSGPLMAGVTGIGGRLAIGVVCGLVGGGVIALFLKPRRLIPEGLENIFVLGIVLFLFQISNHMMPESGIGTVTVAGVVVGNVRSRVSRDLLEFKEQLTVMFIGLLFILLAADVRIADVMALGMPGIYAVLAIMFLVRPLNILSSTWGSKLTWRDKAFLSWLAPRGIVAAAVASIFAQSLDDVGIEGGTQLRAMVFAVIAGTVLVQGLTGGLVARALGLTRPSNQGYAILGASDLARAMGRVLAGEQRSKVVFLDSNADNSKAAEADGFRVVYGNALEERSMARAQIDSRYACIAATSNEEINLLFARRVMEEHKVPRMFVGLQRGHGTVTDEMVHAIGASILFSRERDLELWDVRFRRKTVTIEAYEFKDPKAFTKAEESPGKAGADAANSGGATGKDSAADSNADERPIAEQSSASKDPHPVDSAQTEPQDGSRDDEAKTKKKDARPSPIVGAATVRRFLFPETMLPLALQRGSRRTPYGGEYTPKKGDKVFFAIHEEESRESWDWLESRGWEPLPEDPSTA